MGGRRPDRDQLQPLSPDKFRSPVRPALPSKNGVRVDSLGCLDSNDAISFVALKRAERLDFD